MRFRFLVLFLACIAFPMAAGADEPVVTLKDLEQEALRNNPAVLMAEKNEVKNCLHTE